MTQAIVDVSLNNLIRQVVEENPHEHDIWELTKRVVATTPPSRLLDFYTEALPPKIRVAMGASRNVPSNPESEYRPRSGKANRSRMMEDIAESWYQQKLNARYGIPGRGYVPFRDCTADDFRRYAEDQKIRGKTMFASAKRHNRLVEYMESHGIEMGADVPEDVMKEIFG